METKVKMKAYSVGTRFRAGRVHRGRMHRCEVRGHTWADLARRKHAHLWSNPEA